MAEPVLMNGTTDQINSDGKNSKQLICKLCPSKVLPSGMGTYEPREYDLYKTHKRREDAEIPKEKVHGFFRVEDMFDFDNVGFSRMRAGEEGLQYLICADCEQGPIGYHDRNSKLSYVASERVKHV